MIHNFPAEQSGTTNINIRLSVRLLKAPASMNPHYPDSVLEPGAGGHHEE